MFFVVEIETSNVQRSILESYLFRSSQRKQRMNVVFNMLHDSLHIRAWIRHRTIRLFVLDLLLKMMKCVFHRNSSIWKKSAKNAFWMAFHYVCICFASHLLVIDCNSMALAKSNVRSLTTKNNCHFKWIASMGWFIKFDWYHIERARLFRSFFESIKLLR